MSRKGLNIHKRKNDNRYEGRYIKYYDENGKAKYGYIYAKTYKETEAKLIEAMGIYKSEQPVDMFDITYKNIFELWLQSIKKNIKDSTYSKYSYLSQKHILPVLGKYPLNKMSTQLIERHIEKLLTTGKLKDKGGLSSRTVNLILIIIKSSIKYAQNNGYSVICKPDLITVKCTQKEMRVLSQSEQKALNTILFNSIDMYKLGVLLSLYTGIRVGELCALKWENISISDKILKVRNTLQRIQNTSPTCNDRKTKVIITEPKSKCSIRDIPIPEFLIPTLKKFVTNPNFYVLTGNINYIEPRIMQNKFKTYLIEGNIANANFHSLRHTFATRCIELGFEVKSLSEILGHTNVSTTLSKYVHSSFDLKRDNMKKLNEMVS